MANFRNKTETETSKEQPEKKLWKAVLNQVFQDAFDNTYNEREEGEKKHAWDYLQTMHQDYFMICEYAGFDPNYVHTKVKRKINLSKLQNSGLVWNMKKGDSK